MSPAATLLYVFSALLIAGCIFLAWCLIRLGRPPEHIRRPGYALIVMGWLAWAVFALQAAVYMYTASTL